METGTFPHGILNEEGELCKAFVLHERTFRHSLQLANDPALKQELLVDPVYYDAAIISKRLTIAGIPAITPEMVLDLEGDNGDALANAMMALDKRRTEFRSANKAAPEAAAGVT